MWRSITTYARGSSDALIQLVDKLKVCPGQPAKKCVRLRVFSRRSCCRRWYSIIPLYSTVRTKKCGVAANQSRKCRYLAAKILDFWTLRKRKHSGKNYQYQKTSRKWAITTHREIRWTCGWELHTDIYIRIWLILLCKTKDWTVVHEPETHVKYHAMRTSGFVRTLRDYTNYFKTQVVRARV